MTATKPKSTLTPNLDGVNLETEADVAANSYLPVKKHCKKHSLSNGGMRHLLFNREENGLNACVIRVGRKILIDQKRWDEWLNSHREAQ